MAKQQSPDDWLPQIVTMVEEWQGECLCIETDTDECDEVACGFWQKADDVLSLVRSVQDATRAEAVA